MGFLQSTVAQTNREKLDSLARDWSISAAQDLQAAIRLAKSKGWSLTGINRIDKKGNLIYNQSDNYDAAVATRTAYVSDVVGMTGAGMKMGIWECCNEGEIDGEIPLITHQDFIGRINMQDLPPIFSSHATHVAGTLIGNPPEGTPNWSRGMAYEASLDAYGVLDDGPEMAEAGATTIDEVGNGKLLISNHSYGSTSGWEYDGAAGFVDLFTWYGPSDQFVANGIDPNFGRYNWKAREWDQIAYLAPYYLIVKSAGNDNDDNPSGIFEWKVRNGEGGEYVHYNTGLHPLGDGIYTNGYKNIPTYGIAKNILTVGAVDHSLNITDFSSRGPSLDGRIKPDICGVGGNVYSADIGSTDSYDWKSGTSMASPQVAGSLLLLQQLYQTFYSGTDELQYMKSATLKALAIHTAIDKGNPGPDYTYGWGVLNSIGATQVIASDSWLGTTPKTNVIIEDVIQSANSEDVFEYAFRASGTGPIKVTLVYTDKEGVVDSETNLVNDLDLFVFRPSVAQGWEPYVLDPNNPSQNATTGDNDVDNVEQIYLSSSVDDLYVINVSVEGGLHGGNPQPFSLIVSGLNPDCHANISHKYINVPSGTYTADINIESIGTVPPGNDVTYRAGGKVILKPGFKASQTSIGAGSFRTAHGGCN